MLSADRVRMAKTRRTGAPLLLGLAALAGACVLLPARAEPALRRIATIPLDRLGQVVVDNAARRVIEITGGVSPLTITLYDGERYSVVRKVELTGLLPQATLHVQALDEATRRLYVLAYTSATDMDNRINPHLLSIDADDLRLLADRPLTVFPPGVRVLGIGVQEAGRLALVGQLTAQAAAFGAPGVLGVFVAQMNPRTGQALWGPHPARACESLIATRTQTAVAVFDGAFFVTCKTPDVLGFPLPGIPAVVAVDIAHPDQQSVYFMPGSYGLGESSYDRKAHRLVLLGAAFARPAQAVWVFDLAHRVFVGQTTAGDVNVLGAGVNERTGRLYVAVEKALLVSTNRGLEIPQALQIDLDPFFAAVTPIPFNDRVIVPIHGEGDQPVFTVFRDTLPHDLFPPAKPLDYRAFDRLVTDTPQFTGDAQAYGLRVHELGGFNALVQNVFPQPNVNYWTPVTKYTGVKDGDRDLYFSRVVGAHLSADEATASAIPADGDANTRADYKTVAGKVTRLPQEWPFPTAACNDFGERPTGAVEEGATARCRLAQGRAAAGATHGGIEIPGVASVGATASTAAIRLDARLGLVSEVHAEARDVSLGASVTIGYVASDVTVAALGRPGTASADYRRTFRNVSSPAYSCEKDCDPSAVLAAISDELGFQFRVELPDADPFHTGGGAHGHALREPWEHQQDVVMNNQDPTELQVPALRVTFVGDSAVASRLLLEFAGTKADVTHIRLVPAAPLPAIPETPGRLPVVGGLKTIRVDVPAEPVAAPVPDGVTEQVVRIPGRVWKILFVGGVRSAAVWALFAIPLYMAARRRHLLRLFGTRA